jgi:hypothetical protein
MIGTVFELLKGLPHEADQFIIENVRCMTILNDFLKFRTVLDGRRERSGTLE